MRETCIMVSEVRTLSCDISCPVLPVDIGHPPLSSQSCSRSITSWCKMPLHHNVVFSLCRWWVCQTPFFQISLAQDPLLGLSCSFSTWNCLELIDVYKFKKWILSIPLYCSFLPYSLIGKLSHTILWILSIKEGGTKNLVTFFLQMGRGSGRSRYAPQFPNF